MTLTESQIKEIIASEVKKSLQEGELDEKLGTFGTAVKDGMLKPNFIVEEVQITTHEGKPCLKCHTGRLFGRDDDIVLFSDGTGISMDDTAEDRNFRWTSVRARTTSFGKSIAAGLAAGAALGSLTPAGIKAAKGLATQVAARRAAGKGFSSLVRRKLGRPLFMYGSQGADAITRKVNIGAGVGAAALGAGGYGLYQAGKANGANQMPQGQEGQVAEVAPQLIGAGIGGAVGAIGGGLYALFKNRNNIVYYADGRFESMKGDISGRWDETPQQNNTPGEQQQGQQPAQQKPQRQANQRVMALQVALAQAGYDCGEADGILGPKTKRAAMEASVDIKTWKPGTYIMPKKELYAKVKTPTIPTAPKVDAGAEIAKAMSQTKQDVNYATPKANATQPVADPKAAREMKRKMDRERRRARLGLDESRLASIIDKEVRRVIRENQQDEWFDGTRAAWRGIKNRWNNAVETGKGVVGALRNGDLNGVATELGNGIVRGVEHRAANAGQFVGDKVQNVRDVWNGTKKVAGALVNGASQGYQKGINRGQEPEQQTGLAQAAKAGLDAAKQELGSPKTQQPAAPANAQQAIATVSKLNTGKGWVAGAKAAGWDDATINAYRQVINQYYAQQKAKQQSSQSQQTPKAQPQTQNPQNQPSGTPPYAAVNPIVAAPQGLNVPPAQIPQIKA